MLRKRKPKHPFHAGYFNGHETMHLVVEDRLRCVRNFTVEQCEAALKLADLQKTVRRAIEVRLRKLKKEQ